jgi:TetR/AcrR family transcriptional repressor of nem operon
MAANRERILDIASRLFRERGFDNVSVAEVMQQAGLTHGGFYGHFPSKEALAAQASAHALALTTQRWSATLGDEGMDGLERIIHAYLSRRHRDHPGAGCAIAALGADMARQGDPVRSAFSRELEGLIEVLANSLPGSDRARRHEQALALMAQLVGAIVLSRALGSSSLSEDILDAVRKASALPGKPARIQSPTEAS